MLSNSPCDSLTSWSYVTHDVKNNAFLMLIDKKYIRMGITICRFFIWDGISSDIWSEFMFYGGSANLIIYCPK